eukprot:5248760-Heterocapsa_arctica.AAC.1
MASEMACSVTASTASPVTRRCSCLVREKYCSGARYEPALRPAAIRRTVPAVTGSGLMPQHWAMNIHLLHSELRGPWDVRA